MLQSDAILKPALEAVGAIPGVLKTEILQNPLRPIAVYRETGYNILVIRSFKDDEARKIFSRQWSSRLPKDIQKTA